MQNCAAVVIDFFCRESVLSVEGVNAAEGHFDSAPSSRQSSPAAQVSSTNDDFEQDGVIGNVPALNHDFQIRQRSHELLIERPDAIAAGVVVAPSFIVISSIFAEGSENTLKIVLVFQANMLFDDCDTCGFAALSELRRLPFGTSNSGMKVEGVPGMNSTKK